MVLIENRLVIKENCVLGVDILGTALKKIGNIQGKLVG
jgi:hypothetical protein